MNNTLPKRFPISRSLSVFLPVFFAIFVTACGSLDQLGEDYYDVSPNPLEVHGGKVKVNISAEFPKEVFPKDAAVEATPFLVYEGGETAFESVTYQGEEYPDNFEVISNELGGSVEYEGSVDYSESLKASNLEIRLVAKQGQTEKPFGSISLAQGVITTSLLVEDDEKPVYAESQFEQVTDEQAEAKINFAYNSSRIKNQELRDGDYKSLIMLFKDANSSEGLDITGVNLLGYASPEGEISLNENLSLERANAVVKLIKKELKRLRYTASSTDDETFFQVKALGADWEGLMTLLDKSQGVSLDEKGAIKRSLDDTPMLDEKERTLKNLANTYDVLENDILPSLRRSKVILSYKKVGRTDEDILAIASSDDVTSLSIEEVLHITEVSGDKKVALDVLTKYVPVFSEDHRVLTNLGYYLFLDGKYDLAEGNFSKAYTMEENEFTKVNWAIAKKRSGKDKEAIELLKQIDLEQAKYNYGVILLKQGKYTQAVKAMSSGKPTFNLALAKLLRGDYSGCLKTLKATEMQTAKVDYLRAIASMRMGNVDDAKAYIQSATSNDSSYGAMAEKDLEFKAIYNPEPQKGEGVSE